MQGSCRHGGIDTVILEMQGMISLAGHRPSCLLFDGLWSVVLVSFIMESYQNSRI